LDILLGKEDLTNRREEGRKRERKRKNKETGKTLKTQILQGE